MKNDFHRQITQSVKPFLLALFIAGFSLHLPAQSNPHSFSRSQPILVKGDQYYPPFEFINEQGKPDGFNVELYEMIAEELGLTYQLELGPWDQVRTELEAGEIDVLMGVLVSPERAEKISFGIPHAVMTHGIFTRKNHLFTSLEELRGKEIIVQSKDRMHDYLIETGLTAKIIPVTDQLEALRLLSSGKHDAALLGNFQGLHLIRQNNLKNIVMTSSDIEPQQYAMAVSAGNDELLWLLNMGLYNLKATGEYDRLYNKWFTVYEDRFFVKRNILPILLVVGLILLLSVFVIVMRIRVKMVKKQLRESEMRYRSVFENNHAVMLIIDPDTSQIVDANPAAERFYGYPIARLTQMSISEINVTDPDETNEVAEKAEGLKTNYTEFKQRLASGEIRDVDVYSGEVVFGNKNYLFSIVHDAAEKRSADEKIRQWQDLMQYIIRYDPNAIAVHDSNLRYIFTSERYLKDYRIQEKDIIGKHHYEVFPDIPEKWKEVHQRALNGEVISSDEDVFIRSDGKVDYTRWECRPWYEQDSKIGGIILYTEVITRQKQTETELRKFKGELETQVKEKTQELQERIRELERFHDATIEREFRIKELQQEINRLKGDRE